MKVKYLGQKKRKVLVTGGTGFVGNSLCSLIKNESDCKLYVVGKPKENDPYCDVLWYYTNFLDEIEWKKLKNLSLLFHLAANNDTLDQDEDYMMEANVYAPMRMFQKALKAGCRHFVYASSTAVYGNQPAPYTDKTQLDPLTPYARSKAKFEQFAALFAEANDVMVTGLRFCNIYGPGESHKGHRASMIYQIFQSFQQHKNVKLFKDGEQKRCWLYVTDAAKALWQAQDRLGDLHMIFNIGSPESVSFNYLVERVRNWYDRSLVSVEYIENPNSSAYQTHTECDIQPANEFLNWKPMYSVDDGIVQAFNAEWFTLSRM